MAKHLFKPGEPRPANAGRKKGTPNKKTQEFMAMLENNNFDPGEEMVALFQKQMAIYEARMNQKNAKAIGRPNLAGALVALGDASTTLNNICQYAYPKKKAIEHSGEVGVRTFADFMAAAKGHKK